VRDARGSAVARRHESGGAPGQRAQLEIVRVGPDLLIADLVVADSVIEPAGRPTIAAETTARTRLSVRDSGRRTPAEPPPIRDGSAMSGARESSLRY
jgi:hypothetical protein